MSAKPVDVDAGVVGFDEPAVASARWWRRSADFEVLQWPGVVAGASITNDSGVALTEDGAKGLVDQRRVPVAAVAGWESTDRDAVALAAVISGANVGQVGGEAKVDGRV